MKKLEHSTHPFVSNGKIQVYKIFTYFLVFGFIGWIFETTAVFIRTGVLTDRGFLFIGKNLSHYAGVLENIPHIGSLHFVWGLPFIDMYGYGGIILITFFYRFKDRLILLFFISMIAMTIFELIGSYWSEYVVGRTFWNYSNDFLNFQGRICLRSALAWGALSILVMKFIEPWFSKVYERIRHLHHYKGAIIFLMLYVVLCSLLKYYFVPGIVNH